MNVTIRIYERDNSAAQNEPVLVETRRIETTSLKQLTSSRAAKLIQREFPEFKGVTCVLVKTENGWKATRTVKPTKGCSYHYIWEDAIISED